MVHLSIVWPSTSRPQLRIQPHGSLGAASPGCAPGVALGELHLFHATAVQHGRCGVDGGVGAQWVWGHLCYESSQQHVSNSPLDPFLHIPDANCHCHQPLS